MLTVSRCAARPAQVSSVVSVADAPAVGERQKGLLQAAAAGPKFCQQHVLRRQPGGQLGDPGRATVRRAARACRRFRARPALRGRFKAAATVGLVTEAAGWRSASRWPPPGAASAGASSATSLPRSTIATRLASCSASSMKCVVNSTVVPRWLSERMMFHVLRRAWGSMAAVGSSRNTSRGRPTSARPRLRRCFWPPES